MANGHGASLASVHSEDQMRKMLQQGGFGGPSWIGLFTTKDSGSEYFWTDNSTFDFHNWNSGQPNGPEVDELCVYYESEKWNDFSCNEAFGYVCQIPKTCSRLFCQILIT